MSIRVCFSTILTQMAEEVNVILVVACRGGVMGDPKCDIWPMRILFAGIVMWMMLSSGCSSPLAGVRHRFKLIELSAEEPRNADHGVELVRVAPDGTVTIKALETGEVLSTAVGQPFLGAYR